MPPHTGVRVDGEAPVDTEPGDSEFGGRTPAGLGSREAGTSPQTAERSSDPSGPSVAGGLVSGGQAPAAPTCLKTGGGRASKTGIKVDVSNPRVEHHEFAQFSFREISRQQVCPQTEPLALVAAD